MFCIIGLEALVSTESPNFGRVLALQRQHARVVVFFAAVRLRCVHNKATTSIASYTTYYTYHAWDLDVPFKQTKYCMQTLLSRTHSLGASNNPHFKQHFNSPPFRNNTIVHSIQPRHGITHTKPGRTSHNLNMQQQLGKSSCCCSLINTTRAL